MGCHGDNGEGLGKVYPPLKDSDYLEENFTSIQRIYNVEFARDWNLQNPTGTQEFLRTQFLASNKKNSEFSYKFESLKYENSFTGYKHIFNGRIASEKSMASAATSAEYSPKE